MYAVGKSCKLFSELLVDFVGAKPCFSLITYSYRELIAAVTVSVLKARSTALAAVSCVAP
jgi:hypothetical protein